MKKSKILAISLSSVGLVSAAITAPIVLASCGNMSSDLFKDNIISLKSNSNNASLKRISGTNNYNYWVGESTINKEQLNLLQFNINSANDLMTNDQLKEYYFDINKPIQVNHQLKNSNGQLVNNIDEIFNNVKDSKSLSFTITVQLLQTYVDDKQQQVEISFKSDIELTMIANK